MASQSCDERAAQLLASCAGYDYVRFTFSDIHGIPKCKTVPARHLPKYIKEGVNTCVGTIVMGPASEIKDTETYNVEVLPQVFYPLPWVTPGKYKVGQFLCETFEASAPQPGTPRALARQQLQHLQDLGLTLYSAFEMEFILLDRETKKPLFDSTIQYQTTMRLSQFEDFLFEMESLASAAGISIETMEIEGGPGQFEFAMEPQPGIVAADQAFLLKQLVKELALKHGYIATFMTKPLLKFNANGLHHNFSVRNKDGGFVFYDAGQPDNLSDVAKHWIAGSLKHATSMSALHSPTVNCYRRYHNPWAPDTINWGVDDRYTILRVKSSSPERTYMENRVPGGSANPYLVVAATVAAGIEGIKSKLECPPATPAEKVKEKMPYTLQEALKALQDDQAMTEALGKDFVRELCKVKETYELDILKNCDVTVDNYDHHKLELREYLENF